MKKILFNFIIILLFLSSSSFAAGYKVGAKVSGSFQATKSLKIDLPPGEWTVAQRTSDEFYGLRFYDYIIVRMEKGKIVEAISAGEIHTAGVYEGHLNVEILKIFFKGKYDGCYERPEYFYLNFYKKGSTFNCFRVGHANFKKEINDPEDPELRNAYSQLKKFIRDKSLKLPRIALWSNHHYFSRLVKGKIYVVSYVIDPSILGAPKISYFTEENSEYHKNRITEYPEHEKIMQNWLSISAERHSEFEKIVKAKERHLLNLNDLASLGKNSNDNKSINIAEQLKKLDDLYKSGVLSKDDFEKAKKKILN
tara:strand:+ start:387 stop:1313 length:927 start_codon:yes stop_codon:yes gene_type:complete